jgi:hypothetical protein
VVLTKPSNRVSTFCTKWKTEIFCPIAGPENRQKSSVAWTRGRGVGRQGFCCPGRRSTLNSRLLRACLIRNQLFVLEWKWNRASDSKLSLIKRWTMEDRRCLCPYIFLQLWAPICFSAVLFLFWVRHGEISMRGRDEVRCILYIYVFCIILYHMACFHWLNDNFKPNLSYALWTRVWKNYQQVKGRPNI